MWNRKTGTYINFVILVPASVPRDPEYPLPPPLISEISKIKGAYAFPNFIVIIARATNITASFKFKKC